MICSRLDRLYLNQQLIRIGGQTAIWPTLAHVSDHAPVIVHIQLRGQKRKPMPVFYIFLLTDETERTLLLAEWQTAIEAHPDRS